MCERDIVSCNSTNPEDIYMIEVILDQILQRINCIILNTADNYNQSKLCYRERMLTPQSD